MFSETRVGLYYAYTVANQPSGLVALSATKSVTDAQSEAHLLNYEVPQKLLNLIFKLQSTSLCKQFTYACSTCMRQAVEIDAGTTFFWLLAEA